MKKILLILSLLLIPSISIAKDKLAVLVGDIASFNGYPTGDELNCIERFFERGKWEVDWINVDKRTWYADTSDAEWFEKRYKAILVLHPDCHSAFVIAKAYGTNFQNSAGIARVAYSPLGGRYKIPVYVITDRILPSTTYDDTTYATANNYVAGITHTGPAGSFTKPAEASGGTWRYKQLTRWPDGSIDTLRIDPLHFACRPTTWQGAGNVAAIAWADTTNGLGSCAGSDTIMTAWRWQPRPDRPGIVYCLYRSNYSLLNCSGALFILNLISKETSCDPGTIIKIPFMEHSPEPNSLTAGRISNFRLLYQSLQRNGIARTIGPRTSPTSTDINKYNRETVSIINEYALKNKFCVWHQFTNEPSFLTSAIYTPADTTNFRKAWNQLAKTAVSDTFGFLKSSYSNKAIVTGGGIVGVAIGRVFADDGVKILETTITTPQTNWTFQSSNGAKFGPIPYILPYNDNRILHVRFTSNIGEAATYSALSTPYAFEEYIGRSWILSLANAAVLRYSLYWHTNALCVDDPYASYLIGDIFGKHFRYYKYIIDVDRGFEHPTW